MDYRKFISEFLARQGNKDPASMLDDDMQGLISLSRDQELDERTDIVSSDGEKREVRDVDELTEDSLSLTLMSEPAMDSAIFTQEEATEGDSAVANEVPESQPTLVSPPEELISAIGDEAESTEPLTTEAQHAEAITAGADTSQSISPTVPDQSEVLSASASPASVTDVVTVSSPTLPDVFITPEADIADPDLFTGDGAVEQENSRQPESELADVVTVSSPTLPDVFITPEADIADPDLFTGDGAVEQENSRQPESELADVVTVSSPTLPDVFITPEADIADPDLFTGDGAVEQENSRQPESELADVNKPRIDESATDATPTEPTEPTEFNEVLPLPVALVQAADNELTAEIQQEGPASPELIAKPQGSLIIAPEGREAEFTEMLIQAENEAMSADRGGLSASITVPGFDDLPSLETFSPGVTTESENILRLERASNSIQVWERS